MEPGEWSSVADVAAALSIGSDGVRKRVRRYEKSSDGALVRRVDAGDDGGHDRIEIHRDLVGEWLEAKATEQPAPAGRGEAGVRTAADHLQVENELLRQELRHSEIERHDAEIKRKDDRIAALEAEIERLNAKIVTIGAEKADLHEMLSKALGRYVRDGV